VSQCDSILNHLKSGQTITPIYALKVFGIFRLAARINDLRGQGHKIQTELEYRENKRFARYYLK
jgi:hypothetical protein